MKAKKYFQPVLFSVGFFFLINGNFNIIDFIPDFIGWIFIAAALLCVSDLDYRLEQARKNALWLMAVSASKYLVIAFTDVFFNEINVLLFTFTYCVIESLLLVNFTLRLFDGFGYMAERADVPSVYNQTEMCKTLTLIFFLCRGIIGVLPEFMYLLGEDAYNDITTTIGYVNIMAIRPYIIVISIALVTLFGIAWFAVIAKFFKTIKGETEFMNGIETKYHRFIMSDPLLQLRRTIRYGMQFITLGFVCLMSVHISYVNWMPEIAACAFFIAGALKLSELIPSFKRLLYVAIPAGVISAVSLVLDVKHFPVQSIEGSNLNRLIFERSVVDFMSERNLEAFYVNLRSDIIGASVNTLAVLLVFVLLIMLKGELLKFTDKYIPDLDRPVMFFKLFVPLALLMAVCKILVFAQIILISWVSMILFCGILAPVIFFSANSIYISEAARHPIRIL